jgi:dienelactone hydrolase
MASVVLFHSAYGLRPAVLADAERIRAEGHTVLTPDLYQGAVFDDVDAGLLMKEQLGWAELVRRAVQAVETVPDVNVFIGYSMGAAMAHSFAKRRPGVAGAVYLGCSVVLKPGEPRAPTQLHAAVGDPWVEEDDVVGMAAAGVEVFRYGGGHLFTDPGLPDFDPESAERCHERVLTWLAAR